MIRKPLLALLLLCLSVSACVAPMPTSDQLTLKETTYDQLPGWSADTFGEAVIALQKSCLRINKKKPDSAFGVGGFAGDTATWQAVCADLFKAVPLTGDNARQFFEDHFTPYQMLGAKGPEGLFTGYYEPTLHGSMVRRDNYQTPLYGRPDDLVTIDLGKFKEEWKGQNIIGRVDEDKKVVPYYTRADIVKGALEKSEKEIVWVDSPVDAFFLHIQGSGRVVLDSGKVLRVGYAIENGQPYTAIGKKLLERGALEPGNVSMQSIREWLAAHPDEAPEVMNLNTSYIFFRELNGADEGPLGAEGVPLTAKRSLAVDKKKIPYGVPIWLDAEEPEGGKDGSAQGARLQRLMVAQDTGGAITGAVRGDFFWGPGDEAAHKAGLMKSAGRAWMLLPKALADAANKPAISGVPAESDSGGSFLQKLRDFGGGAPPAPQNN